MKGHVIKTTPSRKLMVKIAKEDYDTLHAKLQQKHEKTATFELVDDDGEPSYFVMLTLDKYERHRMERYEALVGNEVTFGIVTKPYSFEDQESGETISGCNVVIKHIKLALRESIRRRQAAEAISS